MLRVCYLPDASSCSWLALFDFLFFLFFFFFLYRFCASAFGLPGRTAVNGQVNPVMMSFSTTTEDAETPLSHEYERGSSIDVRSTLNVIPSHRQ